MITERSIARRVRQIEQVITVSVQRLAAQGEQVTHDRGAEWLLDNQHITNAAVEQARDDLPRPFYRELPRLQGARDPRAYDLARAIVDASGGHVDHERAVTYLATVQEETALTTGELWALPAFLRLVVLEDLACAAARLTSVQLPPDIASRCPPAAAEPARIAACIQSLRTISATDWNEFVESVSRVHAALTADPAGAYPRMSFETRDLYRKAVEQIAKNSRLNELAVADRALALSQAARDARARHVGYFLVDDGRTVLERETAFRPPISALPLRLAQRQPLLAYLGPIIVLTALIAAAFVSGASGTNLASSLVLITLCLIPALTVAVALVNWAMTRSLDPRLVPALEFEEIPDDYRTLIAIPSLLSNEQQIRELLHQLETNYHGNTDRSLVYALLTDPVDAAVEQLPEDAVLLRVASDGIAALNQKYGDERSAPFILLHRRRMWSAQERLWMGWERKRGKLEQLNHLLLGEPSQLALHVGRATTLEGVKFVITLDDDTLLPQGAAAKLVGTLAHPLNRAVFGSDGRVVAGYTVLQPRVQTLPTSVASTPFSRILESDRGLDLYSHAVSDVYQDLFAEGNYAGKGIYDVAAFDRSLRGVIPDNTVLSHDLLEGIHGRAGLVTNVVVYEEYPSHVVSYLRRLHRWVRGDWQITPWLFSLVRNQSGKLVRNTLPLRSKWKILENLRRSLLAPVLVALLVAGWLLSGAWWHWVGVILITLATPTLLGSATRLGTRVRPRRPWHRLPRRWLERLNALTRVALIILLLPYQAITELDATVRAIWRMLVSHRRLLEWTSAAHAADSVRQNTSLASTSKQLLAGPLIAVLAAVALAGANVLTILGLSPLILWWLTAPLTLFFLSQTTRVGPERLRGVEIKRLRALARRTWAFYERYVGPDDHWLPPDNYQEQPRGVVARRTSPTNIGFYLLSVVAARDFGYLPIARLSATLSNTLDTLDQLERYRGHFLNWYRTSDLQPLIPRYISTVDSGNLAAALITIARACETIQTSEVVPRPAEIAGLRDTIQVFRQTVVGIPGELNSAQHLLDVIDAAKAHLPHAVYAARDVTRILGPFIERDLPQMENAVLEMVQQDGSRIGTAQIQALRVWLTHLHQQALRAMRELEWLVPWAVLDHSTPPWTAGTTAPLVNAWRAFVEQFPASATLRDIPGIAAAGLARVDDLKAQTATQPGALADWAPAFIERLQRASAEADRLRDELSDITNRADRLVRELEFEFLYDRVRHVFHLGYNATVDRLDHSYYDVFASEARLASYIAIAKGEVPLDHWLHLARPFSRSNGRTVLLSWGGTAFEYLMPQLLLRTPEHSLLALACEAAIRCHIDFGRRYETPWGISESGFHQLDAHLNYQYRAFGVPDLGMRRDLGDRLVIAPYASLIALPLIPREVARNVGELESVGARGPFGMYEAIDYGAVDSETRSSPRIVRSYMAHHQGMILVALDNTLRWSAMVERFHRDRSIAAVELLLHEQIPERVRTERKPLPIAREPAAVPAAAPLMSWQVERGKRADQHLISNGALTLAIDANGGGGLRLRGFDATRVRVDSSLEEHGLWVYVQDLDSGASWAVGAAPVPARPDQYDVYFAPHMAEFHRREQGLSIRMDLTVPPDATVAVTRLELRNETDRARRIRLCSYGEVVLAPHAEDRRHPAFVKLFIESEFDESAQLLLFRRRLRSPEDQPLHLAHGAVPDASATLAGWTTDRGEFVGRGGNVGAPVALTRGSDQLTRVTGCTLDPIFALAYELGIPANGSAELSFLTSTGLSAEEARANIERFRTAQGIGWSFQEAAAHTEAQFAAARLSPVDGPQIQQFWSALIRPHSGQDGSSSEIEPGYRRLLWSVGVSGDLPIALIKVENEEGTDALRTLIRIQHYLRKQLQEFDLIVLDEYAGGYTQPLRDRVRGFAERVGASGWLNRSGGIFYLAGADLAAEVRAAINAHATFVGNAEEPLAAQLARWNTPEPARLPPFEPIPSAPLAPLTSAPVTRPADLLYDCGFGGFTADGREYVIHLEPGQQTPAPWSNVIANAQFGALVTENGSMCTWSGNSGERRLTTWNNDPVIDRSGEAIYLRDEETADIWSPTPRPCGIGPHQIRHGAGYTRFLHNSHALDQRVRVFVPVDLPVKVVEITLANTSDRQRRITLTYFAEWVLGSHRADTAADIVTRLALDAGAILARNPFSDSFGARTAFLAGSDPVHSATGDRIEFLRGPHGLARPAGLDRIGLGGRFGARLDPCAALQMHLDIGPHQTRTAYFLLGEAEHEAAALGLIAELRSQGRIEKEWSKLESFWDSLLGTCQVSTPDPAMNLLLNRWLLHQALACRLWGRTAFYQSSGAFGFRDQLQDVLALTSAAPQLARAHIIECARHQFAEGDVLHWWHPGELRGVRTRCSDDLLWLPYVTMHYVEATGDVSLLDESVPFLSGAPLAPGEHERYASYQPSLETASLFEHCQRAIEFASKFGEHGLPLIGTGDWNDGMNRVGIHGQGESVWLAWFLGAVLEPFAALAARYGRVELAAALRQRAEAVRTAVEQCGWDGAWYLRAFNDAGFTIGSARNFEAAIDSITQSWAVLSRMADPVRVRTAMQSVREHLIAPQHRLVRLLWPPFDHSTPHPGYIMGYPPGVRENGGQYTHAAIWVGWALAELGEVDAAYELFGLLNPIARVTDPAAAALYRIEPYVVAGDVYAAPPHAGRGGWSWYTGAASWLYRFGIEEILGLERHGQQLRINPKIPADWPGYDAVYRIGESTYAIRVRRGTETEKMEVQLDGAALDEPVVPLDHKGEHDVVVVLPAAVPYATAK